jgi:acylglycerol lipase
MNEIHFEGLGGLNIFARVWRPETSAPRAVVVIAHGVNSHSGYYTWVGEQLSSAGLAVYALDHRGRGRSDGERYFVKTVDEYVTDIATFIQLAKSREPGLPVFLLGHSAGGVMSAVYTLDHQSELAGFICESFAFRVYAPDFALAVLKGVSHLAPHAHVLRLPIKEFSRDPKVVEAMLADPMIADEVQPTSTVAALVRADERLDKEFPRITLPVLILHGTTDKVTKPSGSQRFFDTAGSTDKELKLYDGHAHDLLNDLGKEAVLADIRAWIDRRIPAR